MARRRDQVRTVLQSFVDDFERMQITDPAHAVYPFFQTSISSTGQNLSWTDANGTTYNGTSTDLQFPLGGDATAPMVHITRWVLEMNETPGVPDTVTTNSSAIGRVIVCQFTATYRVNGRDQSLSIWVIRTDST